MQSLDHARSLRLVLALLCCSSFAAEPAPNLNLATRSRIETVKGSGQYKIVEKTVEWEPKKTAIIICDMWDQHWCKGASARVAEMAPAMNRVVREARQRGVLIIHAPSETMDFYQDTPQRHQAQQAPAATPPVALEGWKKLAMEKEGPLPIDDADGGCDDQPPCSSKPPYPWKRQIATLEIASEDAISDKGNEVYNLLQQRGIDHLIIMGVHVNMCVLGRPFSIRQMVSVGKDVVLMRDMTDSMYCSRQRPFVNHFRGTALVVEHIEKYWCPSITSSAFTGQPPFHFQGDVTGP